MLQSQISVEQKNWIENTLKRMNIEEKIVQVLCWNITSESIDTIKAKFEKVPFGCLFIGHETGNRYWELTNSVKGITDIPVIVCTDLVNGSGSRIYDPNGGVVFPWLMACSAACQCNVGYLLG